MSAPELASVLPRQAARQRRGDVQVAGEVLEERVVDAAVDLVVQEEVGTRAPDVAVALRATLLAVLADARDEIVGKFVQPRRSLVRVAAVFGPEGEALAEVIADVALALGKLLRVLLVDAANVHELRVESVRLAHPDRPEDACARALLLVLREVGELVATEVLEVLPIGLRTLEAEFLHVEPGRLGERTISVPEPELDEVALLLLHRPLDEVERRAVLHQPIAVSARIQPLIVVDRVPDQHAARRQLDVLDPRSSHRARKRQPHRYDRLLHLFGLYQFISPRGSAETQSRP